MDEVPTGMLVPSGTICSNWMVAGVREVVTTVTERALTSTINGIDRMESSSLSGMSIIKVYLRKGTPIGEAVAMVSSVGTAILRQLPRGISPPFVTQSSATDVPVMQLSLSSDTIPEEKLFDIANNLIRTQLATVQGAITPFPYGGKYRQVMIDLNPIAMRSQALSAYDIMQAVNDQSIVAPTGTAKLGQYEYTVVLNNMPDQIKKLNNLPIKTSLTSNQTSAVVLLKDVAKAFNYVLKRWASFTLFLEDGRVCLSNNAAERGLRGIALGRKSWLFCGSDRGGQRAAAMYSLIVTAKMNGIDAQAWLADVLARIATHPAHRLDELLPWNWASPNPAISARAA